jgi:hypothetical protein
MGTKTTCNRQKKHTETETFAMIQRDSSEIVYLQTYVRVWLGSELSQRTQQPQATLYRSVCNSTSPILFLLLACS